MSNPQSHEEIPGSPETSTTRLSSSLQPHSDTQLHPEPSSIPKNLLCEYDFFLFTIGFWKNLRGPGLIKVENHSSR